MEKLLRSGIEILKQFFVFIVVFIASLIVFSIISATIENAHGETPEKKSAINLDYIKIPELVFVKSANVYLGDIAEIRISDPNIRYFAQTLTLGVSPLPGEWRYLKGNYIRALIRGRLVDSIKLLVPDSIKVVSKVRYVTEKEILQELIAYLKSTGVWKERSPEESQPIITGKLLTSPVPVPARDIRFVFNVATGDDLLGPTGVELRILDGEMVFKKTWLRVNISYSGKILVAKRNLRPGDILDDSMVELKKLTIDNAPARFFTKAPVVFGKKVKAFVREGFALTDMHIEEPFHVTFGDIVKVIADNGIIAVSTSAIALGKARIGALVRIQNLNTKKITMAKVIGDGEVMVRF